MTDFTQLASSIIQGLGGPENIEYVDHCITRLRVTVSDGACVDAASIEKLDGVVGVRGSGTTQQVVIGQSVDDVYAAVMAQLPARGVEQSSESGDSVLGSGGNPVSRFMNLMAECFVPIIPPLIAAGLTSAIATLISSAGVLDTASVEYQIISFMGSAPLYFLPFMIAASAGKRLGVNIYITMAVMATLLYPNLAGLAAEGESYISFFGLPIRMATYSNSVFPALLVVAAQYWLERAAKRIIPKMFSIFLEPLCVYAVLTVLALVILGPAATYVGDVLAILFNALSGDFRWLACLIFGTLYIAIVSTGLHHSIRAVNITIFATYGYDPFWGGMCMSSNMALAGAVLALVVASRDKKARELAGTTGLPALLGVTEPAIYGVAFNKRAVLVSAMIGGGISGLVGGILGINGYGMGPAGIMSLPMFIGPTFAHLVIAMILGFAIGFVLSFVSERRSASLAK